MSVPGERAKAMAAGRKLYFTGKPCKHGHLANRKTVSGACVVCHREAQARWDRKREKHKNPVAPAEHREDETPKAISLAAYQGVDSEVLAARWIHEQAARLQVSAETIIAAIRLRWTMVEVEQLQRGDAHQLRDNVNKHKTGEGAVRSDGYLYANTGETE